MKTQTRKQLLTTARPQGLTSAMVAACLAFALMLNSTSSMADEGATTRAEAISQALANNEDAKVLGVKEGTNDDGDAVFIVKIISDGRVKVIRIPVVTSE